jgi:hypothetical protein
VADQKTPKPLTEAEMAALKKGDKIVRRWDQSEWVVEDSEVIAETQLGRTVRVTFRRTSPEVVQSCEPLMWAKGKK